MSPTLRNMVFAAAIVLSSCAELRSGWVKTDFASGRVEPVMVCTFVLDKDGDNYESVCHTLDDVKRRIEARQHDRMGDL